MAGSELAATKTRMVSSDNSFRGELTCPNIYRITFNGSHKNLTNTLESHSTGTVLQSVSVLYLRSINYVALQRPLEANASRHGGNLGACSVFVSGRLLR
jgi:hypothetical protein